jgi:hypothetical protein
MLHAAKKMLDYRGRGRLRDRYDNAATQLRQQLEHDNRKPHSHADNPDRDARLR